MNIPQDKLIQIIAMLVVAGGKARAMGEITYATESRLMAAELTEALIATGAKIDADTFHALCAYYFDNTTNYTQAVN